MTNASPPITIGLVSYNRHESLCRAIESSIMQQPPVPILLVDNASTDGTPDIVARRFGDRVQIIRNPRNEGPVVARQQIIELAETPYIFFLDDDAYIQSADTVEQVVADMEVDPSIAVVAVPYLQDGALLQRSTDPSRVQLTHLFGAGVAAFRKQAVQAVGGYRVSMRMYAEEMELSLRLVRAGYRLRLGTSDPPLVHCPHPDRSSVAQQRYRHRLNVTNTLLCAWWHFPLLHVPPAFRGITRRVWRHRKPAISLPFFVWSVAVALLACVRHTPGRQPLTTTQYLHWCRCSRGEVFLEEDGAGADAAPAPESLANV